MVGGDVTPLPPAAAGCRGGSLFMVQFGELSVFCAERFNASLRACDNWLTGYMSTRDVRNI